MRLMTILLSLLVSTCSVRKEPIVPTTSEQTEQVEQSKREEGYPIDNFKYGDTLIRVEVAENHYRDYRELPVILIAVQYNNIYVRPLDKYGTADRDLDVLDRSIWCCHWVKYERRIFGL